MRWFRRRLHVPSMTDLEVERRERQRDSEELQRRLARIEANLRVLRQVVVLEDEEAS